MGGRDRGEGPVNYLVVMTLIAAITVAITVVALPDTVSGNVKAAVCRVTGQRCASPATTASPGTGATPPGTGATPPGTGATPPGTGTSGTPTGSIFPYGQDGGGYEDDPAYLAAEKRAGAADLEAGSAETDWNAIGKELLAFLADLVGITDAKNCLTKGDILACLMTLVNVLPWGKIFKVLKKIPAAAKLIKKFVQLLERLNKARKEKQLAEAALGKAEKEAIERALKACTVKPNSFAAGTLVRLADGRPVPIEDVRVGDLVLAGDPVTGRSAARPVTGLIVGYGAKHLVDVTVGGTGGTGRTTAVTATSAHPFWVSDRRAWVDAGDLALGDRLATSDHRRVRVSGLHSYDRVERVYNLTVADLHTYYVGMGSQAVLVHNSGPVNPWACKIAAMTPDQLAEARRIRLQYHGLIKNMRTTEAEMRAAGKSEEEIARKLVQMRNDAKDITRAGMSPEDVAKLEQRNIQHYGNPLGPTAEQQLQKYGSWDKVIEAAKRTNADLDEALGLPPP